MFAPVLGAGRSRRSRAEIAPELARPGDPAERTPAARGEATPGAPLDRSALTAGALAAGAHADADKQ